MSLFKTLFLTVFIVSVFCKEVHAHTSPYINIFQCKIILENKNSAATSFDYQRLAISKTIAEIEVINEFATRLTDSQTTFRRIRKVNSNKVHTYNMENFNAYLITLHKNNEIINHTVSINCFEISEF